MKAELIVKSTSSASGNIKFQGEAVLLAGLVRVVNTSSRVTDFGCSPEDECHSFLNDFGQLNSIRPDYHRHILATQHPQKHINTSKLLSLSLSFSIFRSLCLSRFTMLYFLSVEKQTRPASMIPINIFLSADTFANPNASLTNFTLKYF